MTNGYECLQIHSLERGVRCVCAAVCADECERVHMSMSVHTRADACG